MMKSSLWPKTQSPIYEPASGMLHQCFQAICKIVIIGFFTYSEADPSQHILDTLEQCISVIIEKIQRLDNDKSSSRMSSLDYTRTNEGMELQTIL